VGDVIFEQFQHVLFLAKNDLLLRSSNQTLPVLLYDHSQAPPATERAFLLRRVPSTSALGDLSPSLNYPNLSLPVADRLGRDL